MAVGCVGATSGCSSSVGARVASLNPFSNSQAATTSDGGSSWLSAPKNAAVKSRDAVAGWFAGGDKTDPALEGVDTTDPTSLAHKAEVTPEVFVANGRLWESTGNFEKAMESYAKALEKRPNDPDALANIARLHFRQNNHVKAAEYFNKAAKEKPGDAGIHNDLGLTYSKLGNHGAAAKSIERALELAPGSSRYANNLASVKFEAGDATGALEVLVKNNKPAVAHFNMAYLHFKHGQAAESGRHLNQALAYAPDAENDPATKRAVERSRELLAQIGSVPGIQPGIQPGTAVAAAKPTATVQPVSGGTANVNIGNASYKTSPPTTLTATPQAAAPQATTPQATTPQAAAAPADSFALPPNFQLPQ